MTDNNNTTSRGFSYAEPILYRGNTYPSAPSSILDERGIERKGRIFTDANGQYYTLDANGNALPAMMTETLPEVEVRPSQEDTLSTMFSRYLTMGNDKSRINNVPHREYNQHLAESALNGAKAHAQWDIDHPNLSAWRDAATMIPFGVAAIPLAGGLGETALGQAAIAKIGEAMANPIVETANSALGLGMTVKGAKDIVKDGKFTPMTLLDLSGAYLPAKGMYNLIDRAAKAKAYTSGIRDLSTIDVPRAIQTEEIPLGIENANLMDNANEARNLTENLQENARILAMETPRPVAATERQPWDIPTEDPVEALMDTPDFDIDAALARMQQNTPPYGGRNPNLAFEDEVTVRNNNGVEEFIPVEAVNSTNRIPEFLENRAYRTIINNKERQLLEQAPEGTYAYNESPLDFVTPIVPRRTHASTVNTPFSEKSYTLFRARDTTKGEVPYTEEEINSLVNEDGTLKKGVEFVNTGRTGAHGISSWYSFSQSPATILKNHLHSTDPATSLKEMQSIMRSNPTGKSGILIKTKDGDTSVDSTPLAYKMATRLGTRFKPLSGSEYGNKVKSNSYGINAFFKESGADAKRARTLFQKNPDAQVTLLKDADGNMTGMQLTDENGDFLIPLRSRQEVLDMMNKQLHKFNKHYDTSYQDIVPNEASYDSNGNLKPWNFGEWFDLPNIYGISYKKGGKLRKRKGLTF